MEYIIAGAVAFFAGIGSAISGGGAGLVMTPLLLLLGFPPQTALASNKAAGLGVNISALSKFVKQKDVIDWRWAGGLSVAAITAGILGPQLVFALDDQVLRRLVGLTTIALVPVMFLNRNAGSENTEVSTAKKIIGGILIFAVMVLQSAIGSGVGTLTMFIMMGPLGFDALKANATKRAFGLVLVTASFMVFAVSGYIDWRLAAALGSGMFFGGRIGAGIAIEHGNDLIKKALLGVSLVLGLSVLLG